MDKQKLMEWLDTQARLQKELLLNKVFNRELEVMRNDTSRDVHVNTPLLICETLNLDYEKTDFICGNATADHISFKWSGVDFFGLENYVDGDDKNAR